MPCFYIMYLRQNGILCKHIAIIEDMINVKMDIMGIDIIVLNLVEEKPIMDNIDNTNM